MKSFYKISQSQLKSYSKLTQKKYRQSERKFLIEGVHLVEEALKSDWEVEAVIFDSNGFVKEVGKLRNCEIGKGVPLYECPEKDFNKLSDTVTSQGIVAVVKMKDYLWEKLWADLPQHSVIVALDDVADPGNIGTIIRTCDWFGVDGILMSKKSVDLYNPKVVRGTMGSIFHLPIIPDVDLRLMIQNARIQDFKIISTVLKGGTQPSKLSFPERSLIVFGNEAHGVSNEIERNPDLSITIPKFGKAESLNVAISCGIILNAVRNPKFGPLIVCP